MDMKAVIERIEQRAQEEGTTLAALSQQAGMSRDGIRNWKRAVMAGKRVSANQSSLAGVATALGVSVAWLTGEGEDPHTGYDVTVDPRITGFGEDSRDLSVAEFIPVFDVQASAGFGSLVDYEGQTHGLAFPADYLRKLTTGSHKDLVIISTKGDSMEPTLLDDDIVLVDTSKRHMGYEGMFVLRHNDTLLVKRAGMSAKAGSVMLISDNKAYPPIEASMADLTVVGKVLWYGRKV